MMPPEEIVAAVRRLGSQVAESIMTLLPPEVWFPVWFVAGSRLVMVAANVDRIDPDLVEAVRRTLKFLEDETLATLSNRAPEMAEELRRRLNEIYGLGPN